MIAFIGILGFGLLYAWKKGVLQVEVTDRWPTARQFAVYEVHDDPALAISDAVDAEIRHSVKSLEPTAADPSQGTAIYKQILPGIMQMPADYAHRRGPQVVALADDLRPRLLRDRDDRDLTWRTTTSTASASCRGRRRASAT